MARITSPRLIGRGKELARLVAALRRAGEESPCVVLVGGEAGIGKTRLVTEFSRLARAEGATVLAGSCLAIGSEAVPNAPLSGILRALAAELEPAELAQVLGPARDDLARLVPRLAPDGGASGEPPSPGRLWELVLGVFERLAERAALVCVVEDLHWADASTRSLFAFLGRSLVQGPVLLVATYRSDELHRRHPLLPLLAELERLEPPERVEILPLSRDEIAQLAKAVTGGSFSDSELDQLGRLSHGNPFYVEELLAVPQAGQISSDLKEVVLARIGQFPDQTLRLLRIAAAAQAALDLTTLALVADAAQHEIEDAVRSLVERNILVSRPEGIELRHALVQEVLYDELLPGEREQVHREYASALEATRPERVGEIAYHWWRAGDLVRALPKTIEAGRFADGSGAAAEAYTCYERALGMWESLDRPADIAGLDHMELVVLATYAATAARKLGRAVELAQRELDRQSADQPLRQAQLWLALGEAQWLRGIPSQESLEKAVELALSASSRSPERASILADAAFDHAITGRVDIAETMLRETLAAARAVGDPAIEARVLNAEALVLAMRAQELALGRLELALDLARKSGSSWAECQAHLILAYAHMQLGRFSDALTAAECGIEASRRFGRYEELGLFIEAIRGEVLYRLGHWDEVLSRPCDHQGKTGRRKHGSWL